MRVCACDSRPAAEAVVIGSLIVRPPGERRPTPWHTRGSVAPQAPSSGMTQSASTEEGKSPATHQSGGVSGAEESGRGSVDSPHHRTPAATESDDGDEPYPDHVVEWLKQLADEEDRKWIEDDELQPWEDATWD